MRQYLLTAIIALVAGFGGAAAWSYSGLGNAQTRGYLVENPDILPEMAEAYQRGQEEQRLASVETQVKQPFPGAVLGNPEGSRTLVKFTDYACGYCRASTADIDRLVETDPDLRVIVREYPIFPGSEGPARMALAAAQQGKYGAFYHAMFKQPDTSEQSVMAAANAAGLDINAAQQFAASEEAGRELATNIAMAQQLGFSGTPSWVANGQLLEGAVGYEELRDAVGTPRES